jgi:hypothetical protein
MRDDEHDAAARGWFMATRGLVQYVYVDERIDGASFDLYVRTLAEDIDRRPAFEKRGVLYVVPSPGTLDANRRKQVGDVLNSRKSKLAAITAGYALATPSPIARGLLTAVFWLAPPPYPSKVTGEPREALRWLAEKLPSIDAEAAAVTFDELLASARPKLAGVA